MIKISYAAKRKIIMDELQGALENIQESDINKLVECICMADTVFVVGVGRVMLMLQAFAKRLNHLGIRANFVGAIDEPAITEKDVLLVGSGSGESVFPVAIAKIAKKYKAKIVHIGSNSQSTMSNYEDIFVRIPCATKLHLIDEISSRQIMSSLFEQSLLILLDAVAMMIVEKNGIYNLDDLWKYHANLE